MNNEQYLLMKLAEEASEISQIALKSAQFGPFKVYGEDGKNNLQRIEAEFNDLLGIVKMLAVEEFIEINKDEESINAKIEKVNKYRQYSVNLGCVDAGFVNFYGEIVNIGTKL